MITEVYFFVVHSVETERPVELNQVLVGQPNNGLLNKGLFTPQTQIWPVNCSPNIWAQLHPSDFWPVRGLM